MKKAVLLMVVCLMGIIIFSSPVSADHSVNVHWDQRPSYAVTPGGNLIFDWRFDIPVGAEEYTVKILNDMTRNREDSISTQQITDAEKDSGYVEIKNFAWPVPEGLADGRYLARIETIGGAAEEAFVVSRDRGNLTICKFYDRNRNGEKDKGEKGLNDWSFTAQKSGEREKLKCITGSDGNCTFYNLEVGTYTVVEDEEEEKGGCWIHTTPTSEEAVVKKDQTTIVTFGNYEVGTLKITKYNDTNKNSEIDEADKKLPGWEFQVTDPDGKTNNYTTDGNGEIKIDVPVGTYTVKEQLKDPRWIAITPIEQRKTVKKCEETSVEFLNAPNPTGTLFINKFNDINQNKVQDDGEEGLPNWEFTVTKDGTTVATCTTNETGFCTLKLEEGKYTVTEHSKHCWKSTTPTSVETWIRADQPSEVKFGNYGFGTLVIHKFEDFDRDGVQDAGEKDLANWVFEVTQDGRTVDKCTTEEEGSCKLELPAGRYRITEELKTGWRATTPIKQEAEVKVCQETRVSFGNNRSIFLRITKYYDHNMNGERDSGEEGIGNWGFKIKYPDGSVETVTTDSEGIYERYDPPTGKYTISEQPQPCWKNSTPMVRDVEITSDQGAEVEFGNYEFGTLVIYKFNDTDHNGTWDEGELPLPNWGFRVKSADGFIDIPDIPNTDEKGSITIELPANIWFNVTDTFLVSWRNSTPHTQLVYINPCKDTPVTFGNYRPTPINIYKFNDTNGNGIRNSDEEGLAGWDFWISGPNVNDIFTTDENGMVRYKDAIPGQYRIEELPREDQHKDWRSTTTLIREVIVEERPPKPPKPEFFGNQYINITLCEEYGLYDEPSIEPEWYPKSDGYLNVSKHLEPHIVHCDSPNPKEGEIINVTLRVCAFAGMSPTDLVIAVDTSGSLIERGGVVLEVMREGIIAFMEKNKAKFGENGRVGLVSWDEDIDETVNLTTNYSNVTAACERLSSNPEEDTLYQVGLNGSIDVFARSPRGNATKVIVLITDAKGTTDGLSSYSQLPDTSGYVIHAITVGTEQSNGTVKMLENVTSQHSGVVKSVLESSDELAKELTTLTVSSIERRILNNVTVIETLPKYLRAINESYAVPPTSVQINQDGIDWSTETIVWDIGDLSSDKCWESTFKALFCCQMPADESHPIGIPKKTSEVTYTDPTNSSITWHLPIPEGILWIRAREQTPEPSGFEALLAIAGLLAVAYLVWRRKR